MSHNEIKERRKKPLPLRRQVRDWVVEILQEMQLQPGDQIPTEQELIKALNVSRATLREGLQLLEQEGLLRSKHGVGRFLVFSPGSIEVDITKLFSVTEMLNERGIEHRARICEVKEIPAGTEVAERLQIREGEPVISIERIRFAKKSPGIYSIDILPASIASTPWKESDFKGSLLKFLEDQWGTTIAYTHSAIKAVVPDAALAEKVGCDQDVPWILLEQVNYSENGTPIVYSKDYHHGDHISFHVMRFRHKYDAAN